MRAAVIADDLTGALDTGVQFVRAGLHVRVVLPALKSEGPRFHLHPKGTDVLVVDTETRNSAPVAAAAVVSQLAEHLHGLGVRRFYKKIDSTLRGFWVEELEALHQALKLPPTLVCPAFPAMGRTVVEGIVHVWREPGLDLRRELSERATAPNWRERYSTPDAATDADLRRLALAAVETGTDTLLCGSGGLAAAWAPHLAAGACPVPREPAAPCREVLVVAGSRSPSVAQELRRLREPEALAAVASGVVRLLAAPPGDATAKEDPSIAQELAELAREQHRRRPCDGLVLTGGETAIRVLRSLGVRGLSLVDEALPGMPLSLAHGGEIDGARVITKAGGFGGPDALAEAARALAGKS